MVSRSLRELLPLTPSSSSLMKGLADATFPVITFLRSKALSLPMPLAPITCVAVLAGM